MPEKVQLVSVGEESYSLAIPPPLMPAELPQKVQLASAGEEPEQSEVIQGEAQRSEEKR